MSITLNIQRRPKPVNVYETINCVGIDVSKGKSTIAIMRPLGEIVQSPHEVKHTLSDLKELETTLRQLEGESINHSFPNIIFIIRIYLNLFSVCLC